MRTGEPATSEVTDLHQSQSHSFVISKRKARERLAVTGPMCQFPPITVTKVKNVPPLDLSRIRHDFQDTNFDDERWKDL